MLDGVSLWSALPSEIYCKHWPGSLAGCMGDYIKTTLATQPAWAPHPIREAIWLCLAYLPLVIVARLCSGGILYQSAGSESLGAILHLHNWAADLVSAVFFVIPALGIYWLVPLRLVLRRILQSVLLLSFGLVFIVSRKYLALYETEFAWSHIGQEEGGAGLWLSLQAEVTPLLISATVLAVLYAFLWFWFSLRYEKNKYLNINLNAMGGKAIRMAGSQLFWLILILEIGTGMLAFARHGLLAHNTDHSHSVEAFIPEGNVLLNLSLTPDQPARKLQYTFLILDTKRDRPGAEVKKSKFTPGFDTRSLILQNRRRALPFRGRGRRWNIVLYFFESTPVQYIGLHDTKQAITPEWERLQKNSLVFLNHYVNNPLSINALFSVMTSAYALPADRWVARDYPDIDIPDLGRILKHAGYRTAAYHSGYFAYAGAGRFLKNRSFDSIADVYHLKRAPFEIVNWGVDDRAYIQPSIKFATQDPNSPFFIMLLPISPHHPYETSNGRYPIGNPPIANRMRDPATFRNYLNSLNYADTVLGETIAAFKKAGLLENTLFFIFADHGEAFGQHRRNYNHPFYIYEENTHVPFMIYNPVMFKRPIEISSISRHTDILPTVLDALGLAIPASAEGRSLLRGGVEHFAPLHTTWRNHLMGLRDGELKYIYNEETGRHELYDLSVDQLEKNSLASSMPEKVRSFYNKLMELKGYQQDYFEHYIGHSINWQASQDKSDF